MNPPHDPVVLIAALLYLDAMRRIREEAREGPDHVQARAPESPRPRQTEEEHHVLSGQPGGGTVVDLSRRDGLLEFQCKRPGCTFRRGYGTLKGAKQGISEHLLAVHRVVAVWSGEGA